MIEFIYENILEPNDENILEPFDENIFEPAEIYSKLLMKIPWTSLHIY